MKFKLRLPIRGKNRPFIKDPRLESRKRALPNIREMKTEIGKTPPVSSELFTTTLAGQDFYWLGHNRSMFYRYLRDHIPIISAAVWSWVHLCATRQSFLLEGPDASKDAATKLLTELDTRINENPFIRRPAVPHLTELLFLELFTVGKFACSWSTYPSKPGIQTITTHNTDNIIWKFANGLWNAYFLDPKDQTETRIDPANFFWATLGADQDNPQGIEPLAAIPFVAQIQESLAYDMAKSSHNAGTPRLQIKITPPPSFPHESEKEYQARINTYFDQTVSEFDKLEPDENLFTWNDIEVKIVGGDIGRNFAWRLNREQIIEDVITGLHLYPWVLGRSHGTTKNWVESQFNVLMQVVDTVQDLGVSLADWIRNTELGLQKSPITTHHIFAPNQDPFIVNKMNARSTEFQTIDLQVKRGYISKDEGARRLGLDGAFRQDNQQTPPERS